MTMIGRVEGDDRATDASFVIVPTMYVHENRTMIGRMGDDDSATRASFVRAGD